MQPATTVDFASAARELTRVARRRGLLGPSYRCPPRLVGVDRSIRRRPDGAVVSVRLRGRPWAAVLADMIEGVIVANGLGPPQSDRLRADLWVALGLEPVAAPPARPSVTAGSAAGSPDGSSDGSPDATRPGRRAGDDRVVGQNRVAGARVA